MKNIHILPADKPSRLHFTEFFEELVFTPKYEKIDGVNIYITSDEEIKEGDYFIAYSVTIDKKPYISCASEYKERKKEKGKIILTTDVDLIKDGIQAIDDEFLEWFVKNPSCERVDVDKTIPYNFDGLDSVSQDKFLELFHKSELFDEIKYNDEFDWSVNEGKDFLKLYPTYKIFIPKEESKQETLEDIKSQAWIDFVTTNKDGEMYSFVVGFNSGYKLAKEQMCNHSYILTDDMGHRVIKCSKCNDTQPI